MDLLGDRLLALLEVTMTAGVDFLRCNAGPPSAKPSSRPASGENTSVSAPPGTTVVGAGEIVPLSEPLADAAL